MGSDDAGFGKAGSLRPFLLALAAGIGGVVAARLMTADRLEAEAASVEHCAVSRSQGPLPSLAPAFARSRRRPSGRVED
jgi:hypothetical protein